MFYIKWYDNTLKYVLYHKPNHFYISIFYIQHNTEWYTPKSAMKASCCGCWLSFYAIIIGAISLASSIGEFHEKYGNVECSKDNVDKLIEKELEVYHYWKYLSLALIIFAIIDLCISVPLFCYNRLFEIDQFDGTSIKNVRLWQAKRSRFVCIINGIVKFAIIILLNIWFFLMVIIYAAFRFIVHATECSHQDVSEEAEIKKWLFWMLIFFSVPIVCCILGSIGTICGCICCCTGDKDGNNQEKFEKMDEDKLGTNHIIQV